MKGNKHSLHFFCYYITEILQLNYKCIKTIDFRQKKDKMNTDLYDYSQNMKKLKNKKIKYKVFFVVFCKI